MAFKRNILIVDDEPIVLHFLKDGLSSYQDRFTLHIATSAEDALRILDAYRIALVTTDIRMPGMDGLELLLHAKKKSPDTRFIVMTAYGSDEVFEKSMEYGAIDYIKKPFAFDHFVQKMFQALKPAKGFRAGNLHGFNLTDALQLVHMVGKSLTISVKTEFEEECLIYLKDGEVVHAELEDLEGEDAFYKIIALEGGEIESSELPEDIPITIRRPLAALILEGMRLKDEREATKKTSGVERKISPEIVDLSETESVDGEKKAPLPPNLAATTEQSLADTLKSRHAITSELFWQLKQLHDSLAKERMELKALADRLPSPENLQRIYSEEMSDEILGVAEVINQLRRNFGPVLDRLLRLTQQMLKITVAR